MMSAGHERLVADALRALPDEMPEREPALLGVTALLMRMVGDHEQAVRLATLTSRAARQLLRTHRNAFTTSERALLADAALLNAWLARLGWHDVDDALAAARSVVGEPPSIDSLADGSELDPARLSWLLHELAVLETWVGDVEAATRHADEGLLTARAVGIDRQAAAALADRAVLQLLDGQFQTAANTAIECLAAAANAQRQDDGYMSRPHLVLGWAAFYDLQLEAAAEELAQVRRIELHAFDPLVAALAQVLDARLVAEQGDVAQARRMLAVAAPRVEPAPAYLDGIFAVVRAHWALVDGDITEAEAEVPTMRRLGWDVSTFAFEAVIADLRGDPVTAEQKLEQALSVPAHGEQLVCAAFASAYSARLHLEAGQVDAARESLRDALTRAAPQRMLHPLLATAAAGPAYHDLLVDLARGPDSHPFARSAVEAGARYHRPYRDLSELNVAVPDPRRATGRPVARPLGAQRAAPGPGRSPTPLPPQPLTGREGEVLRELALGGSYRDIAEVLFVTENTVKTHVAAIYRKLGADRRADALRMARQIGLI